MSFLGELALAHTHLEQGITLYAAQQHRALAVRYGQDLGVLCHTWAALALWLLGYPDEALQHSQAAIALAQELVHPWSLVTAINWVVMLHLYRGEGHAVRERTETMMALVPEHGYTLYRATGTLWHGWALAEQAVLSGNPEQCKAGIAQMRQGLAAWLATGAGVFQPSFLALLAGVYGAGGQVDEGLHVLAEALAVVDQTGERWWKAELYRLKGELLLRQTVSDARQAETCFQQARSLELRAAMSLARLWQHQGKRAAALQLLAGLYGWFSEGFDTADLQATRALLEELGK